MIADAFDTDLKKNYETCEEIESQAEIVLMNNPYMFSRNLFEKSSMKIRKCH